MATENILHYVEDNKFWAKLRLQLQNAVEEKAGGGGGEPGALIRRNVLIGRHSVFTSQRTTFVRMYSASKGGDLWPEHKYFICQK